MPRVLVARTVAELRAARHEAPGPVGFVPTLGYLHQGHISLVDAARAECATVVASIFVNPTQFGPTEDLAAYPRDEERDLRLAGEAGAELVWAPSIEDVYPDGFAIAVDIAGTGDAIAIAHGVHSADVVLNILARRRDVGPPLTVLTPAALTLRHPPIADCARYDNLRRTN